MKNRNSTIVILTFLFIVCFLFTGCVSTSGNISTFGNATKGVTDKINAVIKEYNETMIQEELSAIAQSKSDLKLKRFKDVEDIIIGEADKKKYALYKATNALGTYAQALTGLANADSRDQIDSAASKLYGSLNNMNEQYKTLAETKEDLLSKETNSLLSRIVAESLHFYVEYKKNKKLKEIILAANKPIGTICDVIEKELLKGVIESDLYRMRHTELFNYIEDYNDIVATKPVVVKKKKLDEIYEKYLTMKSSSASVQTSVKAIRAIKKAHNTLYTDLQKDNFSSSDIVKAIGDLQDIHDHYDDLEAMMLSCETEIIVDPYKGIICKEKE